MKLRNIFYSILLSLIVFACGQNSTDSVAPVNQNPVTVGQGGSLSRFAIVRDYLYVLSNYSVIAFSISNPDSLQESGTTFINTLGNVETIFSTDSNLFFGSTVGMLIYGLTNPSKPVFISNYSHIQSCDPVVADSNLAYVTLRTGTKCNRGYNSLEIVNIKNLSNPTLIKSYGMTHPVGLGKLDGQLMVCDDGLKVYNVADPNNIKLLQTFNINAMDLIPTTKSIIVTGSDGIYQYKLQNGVLSLLSKIAVQ